MNDELDLCSKRVETNSTRDEWFAHKTLSSRQEEMVTTVIFIAVIMIVTTRLSVSAYQSHESCRVSTFDFSSL